MCCSVSELRKITSTIAIYLDVKRPPNNRLLFSVWHSYQPAQKYRTKWNASRHGGAASALNTNTHPLAGVTSGVRTRFCNCRNFAIIALTIMSLGALGTRIYTFDCHQIHNNGIELLFRLPVAVAVSVYNIKQLLFSPDRFR